MSAEVAQAENVTLAQEKDLSGADNAIPQNEVAPQDAPLQENGTVGEEMDVDEKPAESHETTNGTGAEKTETAVPPPAPTVEDEKKDEAPVPAQTETNGTDEPAPAVQAPPPTTVLPSDESQTGDKRKADELASTDPAAVTGASKEDSEEQDAKKPKVADDAAQANGGEPVKRKPGRPPKSGNSAAKKEKKAPTVGKAERRTRSQGGL